MKRAAQVSALCALCLIARNASAHLVSTRFGELYNGMLHPLITLQHVVPWLALGLLAGLQPAPIARRALWSFPLGVGVGTYLGAFLPALAFVTWLNVLSFVALGLLVALAAKVQDRVAVAVAIVVGLSHGVANAAPGLQPDRQVLYVLGVAISAYVLVSIVTAIAHVAAREARWGTIALRAAGSWIAAIGLIFAGFSALTAP